MEFLEKHTKIDKNNLIIEMTDSGSVNTTSGIEICDILSTVNKVDFRGLK